MTPTEIKTLRAKLGLTQSEFGKLIGLSRHAVQSIEIGRRQAGRAVMMLINILIKENTMGHFDHILLRANSIEGIKEADIVSYPDAKIMQFDDFVDALRSAEDNEEIFTMVLPEGTDGKYEQLKEEYGIK